MPQWIHDRADHIRRKNPSMPKSEAFAIATQQSYAAGKAPHGYGTAEGRREAKAKYDGPKSDYKKTPDPKTKKASISLVTMSAFRDELEKIASGASFAPTMVRDVAKRRLSARPKLTSAPQGPLPPSPQTDPLSSSRAFPPPPVTSG
jgi:hypothetical protein